VRGSFRIGLLSVAAFAAWAFWPVDDPGLEIRFDEAQMRAARTFLGEPVSRGGPEKRPNVVLIVADDLGKYDISVYGPSPTPTPNIARLADAGVTFTEGYVTSPVCSPSRAALMTGRYQQRYGFETLVHERYPSNRAEWWFMQAFLTGRGWYGPDELRVPRYEDRERQGIPPSELLISELLAKHGYRTAIAGKWHLGFGPDLLPQKRGFEHQYGFYDAFSLYGDPKDPNMIGVRDDYFADRYQWWRGRSGGSAILRDGVVIDEDGYLTEKIAAEAVRWIVEHKDEPFFAYVPFSAPHAPFQAPREYVERFLHVENPKQRVYFGMIAALDDAVGEILDGLETAGVAQDTIVVFLSDNGAASYTGFIDNAPLKGGKLTNFEGGVNVPFLMRWPGRVPAATTYARPVSSLDVFMTIARAAGVALPTDRLFDGVDLLPYLRGALQTDPHEALFWRAHGHRAVRAGRFKLVSDARTGSRELFDLEVDPYEKLDVAAQRADLADRLEQRLRQWEAGLVPPRWPNVMEYRFSDGSRRFVFPL
jgi:arylsulfatase A-like enzyme